MRARRRLVELADIYGDADPVVIPLSQEEIATMAGTTRATLNQFLKDEERLGSVAIGRAKVTIVSREQLRARA